MDRYLERPVAMPARGLIACAWSRRIDAATTGARRIVPDACADVIWYRESGLLLVAGPDTRAHLAEPAPGEIVGLRFHSGHAPAGLGLPADAVRDERVALTDLWRPDRVRRLAEELAATASTTEAVAVLTGAVLAGARAGPDPAVPALLRLAAAGTGVRAMAGEIGLTERQLHRRCLAAFGYGAKVLARVLRFDRAMRLARGGAGLADVAYRAGYADQAHLSREVRALAGVTPTDLLDS